MIELIRLIFLNVIFDIFGSMSSLLACLILIAWPDVIADTHD